MVKIPAISFEQVMAFTNKIATDAYRGAGRPEACYIAERVMDVVAGELQGRSDDRDIVLFKSTGLAAWDIAAAARVVELLG